MSNNKVWYITGASKGLGLVLVKQLLAAGNKVAATSRNITALQSEAGDAGDRFLPLAVDLQSEESIQQSIQQTIAHFGRVDVIVNNAGYGLCGALEELSFEEIKQNFDVNLFGTIHVIKAALPYLRKQQSGHIINISSIAGFTGSLGSTVYASTKFAIGGLSESLALELRQFGIHVTIVSPGAFRTNFLANDSLAVPANVINEYSDVRERIALLQSRNGMQEGDPEKGVATILAAAAAEHPPLHLFLGADAYQRATAKIAEVQTDLYNWKELATITAFDH